MDERLEKATKELADAVADKSKEAIGKAKNMAENIDAEEINKNVKEISKKTKKELEKHSKKEIAVGAAVIIVLFAILSKIGWANIFAGLLVVDIIFLIYDIVQKKKKRNSIIIMVVLLLLIGVFDRGQGISSVAPKNDLIHVFGKTSGQIEKEYGKASNASLDGEVYMFAYEGWAYFQNISLSTPTIIGLNFGNKTLGGISIGDTKDKVDKIMKKAGLEGGQSTITGGADTLGYGTSKGKYHFDVCFDMNTNTVKSITAYDLNAARG